MMSTGAWRTKGFASDDDLEEHFLDHGADFGAATKEEYEEMADAFLGEPLSSTARQCTRQGSGDILRYDLATEEFGILTRNGIIRTYFVPDPRQHRHANNLAYFKWECQRK
jgi:pyocin large subunit-like protein